jgi:hypothetical protein
MSRRRAKKQGQARRGQDSQFARLLARAVHACAAEGLFLLVEPAAGKRGECWALLCRATGREVAGYFPATRRLRVGGDMRQCASWREAVEAAARLRVLAATSRRRT